MSRVSLVSALLIAAIAALPSASGAIQFNDFTYLDEIARAIASRSPDVDADHLPELVDTTRHALNAVRAGIEENAELGKLGATIYAAFNSELEDVIAGKRLTYSWRCDFLVRVLLYVDVVPEKEVKSSDTDGRSAKPVEALAGRLHWSRGTPLTREEYLSLLANDRTLGDTGGYKFADTREFQRKVFPQIIDTPHSDGIVTVPVLNRFWTSRMCMAGLCARRADVDTYKNLSPLFIYLHDWDHLIRFVKSLALTDTTSLVQLRDDLSDFRRFLANVVKDPYEYALLGRIQKTLNWPTTLERFRFTSRK
jgi:hypothetical protein